MKPGQVLVLFAKKPVLGKVKTRLQPHITPENSLLLYRAFVESTLERVATIGQTGLFLGCYPDHSDPWFDELSKRFNCGLFSQEGNDLGERMANAFNRFEKAEFRKKVIIGTDSPHLPLPYIQSSFRLLESVSVVLGPSRDGGYYLIGACGQCPAIFDQIRWSTESVFRNTVRILEKKGIPFRLLPEWFDIDRFEELRSLRSYWKGIRSVGGEVPDRLFNLLDQIEEDRSGTA